MKKLLMKARTAISLREGMFGEGDSLERDSKKQSRNLIRGRAGRTFQKPFLWMFDIYGKERIFRLNLLSRFSSVKKEAAVVKLTDNPSKFWS